MALQCTTYCTSFINDNGIFIILLTIKNTLFDGGTPPITRITHFDPDYSSNAFITERYYRKIRIEREKKTICLFYRTDHTF